MALKSGQRDIAAFLIDHGLDINILNAAGRTALHEAAKGSPYENANFLLHRGAAIDTELEVRRLKDNDRLNRGGSAGLTPLHEAIGVGDAKILRILIDAGVDKHPKAGLHSILRQSMSKAQW